MNEAPDGALLDHAYQADNDVDEAENGADEHPDSDRK